MRRASAGWALRIALILLFVPLALIGGAVENDLPFKGGLNWQSLSYAMWEAFVCVACASA